MGLRGVEGKRTRRLMIEKHKSQMCFLCPTYISRQTAARVVLSYLLPLAEKSSSSAVGEEKKKRERAVSLCGDADPSLASH